VNPNTLSSLGEVRAAEALQLRASLIAALLEARITDGDQFASAWSVAQSSRGEYTIVNVSGQSLPISSSSREVIEAVYVDVSANLGR